MSKYSIRNYNFLLAIAAIALSVYGIFIIGSAKESVQSHQIQGLVLGVIVMIVISLIRYDLLLRLSWLYYVLAVGLLIMVEIAGESVNNAKRWVSSSSLPRLRRSSSSCSLLPLSAKEKRS